MARNIPAGMQTALDTRVTTMCFCWKITRTDGTILGFTDHDADVTYDGVTFEAATSFSASAFEDQQGLAVSNLEAMGAISSDAITENDLRATRYDYAEYEIQLVDWTNTANRAIVSTGNLGKISSGDIEFRTELRSLRAHYSQYIGSLCVPRCRVKAFGGGGSGLEAGCQADVASTVRTGTVASVTDRKTFTINAIGGMPADGTGGTKGSGFYAFGSLKFTSGDNSGIAKEVKTQTSGVDFVMKEPFPLDIQVGDAFELTADCDRTMPVCIENWNQILNRRAEDYVPGSDQVFRVHT